MTQALKTNQPQVATKTPKVVVRAVTAAKAVVITSAMKAKLKEAAKRSTRRNFPELPEWRSGKTR
ncbi:hypothetical protein [Cupriavidus basilensis]